MKTQYNGHSEKSGIYRIINTVNDRVYIGSAKQFKSRYYHHLKSLHKGTHHNKYLQHDFNKHGEDVFIFEVLEVVEGKDTIRYSVEQTYIDQYYDNQQQCYNFKKQAKADDKSSFSKNPEETIRKRIEKLKGQKRTEETKRKMSESQKGRKQNFKSEETRLNSEATRFKKGIIPDNIEFIKNFNYHKELSEERKKEIYKKISESHKGKKLSDETRKKMSDAQKKRHEKRNDVEDKLINIENYLHIEIINND